MAGPGIRGTLLVMTMKNVMRELKHSLYRSPGTGSGALTLSTPGSFWRTIREKEKGCKKDKTKYKKTWAQPGFEPGACHIEDSNESRIWEIPKRQSYH
jgi:hypothetical protein